MPDRDKPLPLPWQVPVAMDEVAEGGRHFDLVADADIRAAVAKVAGLRDLPRFEADFDVTRQGAGLHVCGRVSATVEQTCVVTLEPLANEVTEDVDLLFVAPSASANDEAAGAEHEIGRDKTEPLIGGAVDLGALATEFLILGLDPYPRKAGAVFVEPAPAESDAGAFAALAALKKDRDGA